MDSIIVVIISWIRLWGMCWIGIPIVLSFIGNWIFKSNTGSQTQLIINFHHIICWEKWLRKRSKIIAIRLWISSAVVDSKSSQTDILDVKELVDPEVWALASDTRLFDATEGHLTRGYDSLINANHSHFECTTHAPYLRHVLWVEIAGESYFCAVRQWNHFLLSCESMVYFIKSYLKSNICK